MVRGRGVGWAFLAALVFMGIGEGPAAAGGCGPFEDAERASHRPLSWKDFQGPPPNEGPHRGESDVAWVRIRTSLRVDSLRVVVERHAGGAFVARGEPCVRAYLLKHLSGLKRGVRLEAEQLEHEQGHFDVAQLHAQRLAAGIRALAIVAPSALAAEQALRGAVQRSYREESAANLRAQGRYDRATQYGQKRSAQRSWEVRLAAQLAPR